MTVNCVDLRKINSMIDITQSIELESEFQSNFIIDLTSRYNSYKKAFAKATIGYKKEDLVMFVDDDMANAGKGLSKMQEDKFFCLVSKYVIAKLEEVPCQVASRQAPDFRCVDGRCQRNSSRRRNCSRTYFG